MRNSDSPIIPRPLLRAILSLTLWLAVVRPAAAELVCTPDRSVVNGGESVTVAAYSDSGPALQTGSFSGPDNAIPGRATTLTPKSFEARWTLPKATGTYQISGTAVFVDGATESCKASVIVTGSVLGPGVESGRLFLPASSPVPPGFGSYTYFLCPPAAEAPVRTRCESAVKAFVDALPDIKRYQSVFKKPELNTVYVPVASLPAAPKTAADFMKVYDFPRARRWLNYVDRTLRDGPYLVTAAKPLSATKQQFILLDLGRVPPDVVASWITAYLRQLAQETAYGRAFEPSLALRLRTVLGVLAIAVPDISAALKTVISVQGKP